MAPRPRNTTFGTREQRRKLKVRKKAYAQKVLPGLRLLYRKNQSGGVWYAERYEGNGKYQPLGYFGAADDHADANGIDVLNYDQAVRKLLLLGDEKVREEKGLPPVECTVRKVVLDYLADYRSRSRCKESSKRASELAAEKHIFPRLGHVLLSELTQVRLRNWFNSLAKAEDEKPEGLRGRQATANRIRTILMAALTFAHNHGMATAHQLGEWKKVKPFRSVDVPRVRFLTTDEISRFLKGCNSEFRPLAEAALLTGGRYGELTALRAKDYDAETGTVFFSAGKSATDRHVPLTPEGQSFFDAVTVGKARDELIFLRASGRPWAKSEQARPMKQACKAAKIIPGISFHILRHSYGSLLATKGVPMKFIAEALGHVDTRITERHYGHLHKSVVHDVIRANLPKLGVTVSKVVPISRARHG